MRVYFFLIASINRQLEIVNIYLFIIIHINLYNHLVINKINYSYEGIKTASISIICIVIHL
jgi:hypothetical protein